MTLTDRHLADIERRLAGATKGPWWAESLTAFETLILSPKTTVMHAKRGSPTDADFIAHARADIETLLGEVKRLRAERDAWKQVAPVLPLEFGFCPECGVVPFDDEGLCQDCGALAHGTAVTEMRFRMREAESEEPFVPTY